MKERFGPYILIDRIATGGMGEIFLARLEREEGFQKLLVIKRMLPHLNSNQEFITMFNNEARIAAQLNHQNIVHVFDFGKADDFHFICMEYLRGEDLRSLLARARELNQPLPPGLCCRIVAACCQGLHYAHNMVDMQGVPLNLIHRDVSPQNILISFEGEVKLTDFGLAKAHATYCESVSGVLKGKYSYMTPEQVNGLKLDHRSDIFSLGAVYYEMLTGEKLFDLDEEGVMYTLNRIGQVDADAALKDEPRIPAALKPILSRALARNREERYATALEMQGAVNRVCVEGGWNAGNTELGNYLKTIFADKYESTQAIAMGDTQVSSEPIVLPLGDGVSTASMLKPVKHASTRKRWLTPLLLLLIGAAMAVPLILWLNRTPSPQPEHIGKPLAVKTMALPLKSIPPGARIVVNGRDTGQTTPAVLKGIRKAGMLRIELKLKGHEIWSWRGRASRLPTGRAFRLLARTLGLAITSLPAGAAVKLDGIRQKGLTPLALAGIAPGAHKLLLVKEHYEAWEQEILVEPGRSNRVEARLIPREVMLRIYSNPARAAVKLDGIRQKRRTPFGLMLRPGKVYRLQVLLKDHRAWKKTITLKPGQNRTLRLKLKPLGLRLTLEPSRLQEIHLNRRRVSGLRGYYLKAGAHIVKLVDTYTAATTKLRLVLNRERKSFSLTLDAKPWAKVVVDGRGLGATPVRNHACAYGKHRILLRKSGKRVLLLRLAVTKEGRP